jgi:alpha-tubulin suppressor-like RCC1 family protein
VRLSSLGAAKAIATGVTHSVVVKADGTVWAFGVNDRSQLGDGSATVRLGQVQVTGLDAVKTVRSRGNFTLAQRDDGRIAGLSSITSIVAGEIHGMAKTSDGRLYAWGDNDSGKLGVETRAERLPATRTGQGKSAHRACSAATSSIVATRG